MPNDPFSFLDLGNSLEAQSLDTDVQRPFYSVATVALLPY